jgi:hypothetical protein
MTEELPLCECGCGLRVTKKENRFINRVASFKENKLKPIPELSLCECGCGLYALPRKRFIHGHNSKGDNNPMKNPDTAKKISKNLTGVPYSVDRLIAHRKDRRKEKDPLPNGWEIKTGKMAENKNCGIYLGNIAEHLLSKIYPNVQVMPQGNPGYDFICGKGLKIDVKSSTVIKNRKHAWFFTINKNAIPNYFILIAFDNRENFNILHWWLIPGYILNNKFTVNISESTLSKWSEYEQSISKAITHCNEMRVVQ